MKNFITAAVGTAQSTKVAVGTASATVATGTATMMDLIPDDIGKISALLGALLSVILAITHILIYRRKAILMDLEIAEKRRQGEHDEQTNQSS